jgi:hypothetical protein
LTGAMRYHTRAFLFDLAPLQPVPLRRPHQSHTSKYDMHGNRPQRFRESDAPFNVGGAVGAVQVLPAGVFVVMGGAVFPHDQCRRNLESGAFEGLSPFAVGDKVLVEEPIESDFEDSLDLPQGTVGNVLSIDAEGDAYIDFGGSIGKQWVSSRQFGKLWSPNEDEDAPPSSGADVPLFPS